MAEDLLERLKRRVDEQRRVFGFLASSLDEEGRLDGLMRRCDGQRRVLSLGYWRCLWLRLHFKLA